MDVPIIMSVTANEGLFTAAGRLRAQRVRERWLYCCVVIVVHWGLELQGVSWSATSQGPALGVR